MLTNCPECELQVSDKAVTCPHCGYPLQNAANGRKQPQKAAKHLRLPNGFGQITELKTPNLRNRFRVMVTVGKTAEGKPISKIIKPQGYFKTYNEAYKALVEYNKKKISFDSYGKTIKEVYEEWLKEFSNDDVSESYLKGIRASWKYCEPIQNAIIGEVKAKVIKDCILESEASDKFKPRIKSTLSKVFDYAMQMEYVDRNPVKSIHLPKAISSKFVEVNNPHNTFTDEEMQKLWTNAERDPYVKMILIQCYSGWRPGELTDLRISDVDLANWTFTGGMKTSSGKNRTIPIHSKIRDFVQFFYDRAVKRNIPFLFTTFEMVTRCGYDQYYKMFDRIIDYLELNPAHKPHDPRKHFITEAKRCGVDEYALKRIVGHRIDDVTEGVYTERSIEWLRSELEKI